MKKSIKGGLKTAHTSNSPRGMGEFTGSGVKNKVGRIRSLYSIDTAPAKNIGTPPKSLA
jgi:hypothetical protein